MTKKAGGCLRTKKEHMNEILSEINKPGLGKVIFWMTIGAAIFWIGIRFIPVYENKIVGAISELLWLPTILILFILPLFSFLLWAGEKFKLKSVHLLSVIIAGLAILGGYLLG
jgi:hypothetical protein